MLRAIGALILAGVSAAGAGFHASSAPLSPSVRAQVLAVHEWHAGCPVPLSHLRVLSVTYRGFDGRDHPGALIVNRAAVAPLTAVFRRLYGLHFPIRHMRVADTYGAKARRPADGDVTASFECRQASSSPCNGAANTGTGTWSEHAYGEAIDVNPVENPYVGCGATRDRSARRYLKRRPLRRGMVPPGVVRAFTSAGWGWGGAWSGSTKDYMHFSATGH